MDYQNPSIQTVGNNGNVSPEKVGWVALLVAMVTVAIAVAVGPD